VDNGFLGLHYSVNMCTYLVVLNFTYPLKTEFLLNSTILLSFHFFCIVCFRSGGEVGLQVHKGGF
jgi:hypothetical protein